MSQSGDLHPLLPRIEAFLRETGIAESTFGRRAVGDWTLVDRLRSGGDMRRQTERRLIAWMASAEAENIVPRPRRRRGGRRSAAP